MYLLTTTATKHDLVSLFSEFRPTPEVSWTKVSGELPPMRMSFLHFQKTLRIVNVSDSDAGDYRCTAKNRLGAVHHTIRVSVKGTSTPDDLFSKSLFYSFLGSLILASNSRS